jgi:S-adenosylmethionine synthetase
MAYLTPDGTFQVGVEYRDRRPSRIHSINVVVSQHERGNPDPDTLQEALLESVIQPVLRGESVQLDKNTRVFVNPGGPRIGGGPAVHAGLTGRKTAMDTYGDYARQSGSALSGKDPLRVDRSAAYAARHAAKVLVAAGLATECEVQLSYAIGLARPVSVQVETFGTGIVEDEELTRRVEAVFDFRVGAIIRDFRLRHLPGESSDGFFQRLAAYGQVGRTDLMLPWEDIGKADALS